MKNFAKFLGIIALVAVIGFSMAACGGEEDDNGGGGSTTVIFKNDSTKTVNFVKVADYINTLTEDKSANIAPGAEKSYKISPNRNTDYFIYMGADSTSDYSQCSPMELASGKTYTATWDGSTYQGGVTVTVK